MKSKTIAILLGIFLIYIVAAGAVSGQTATPGVLSGDVFKYDYKLAWSSTDSSIAVPDGYLELNNTESLQIRVDKVSGSVLTLQVTYVFKNGSSTYETGQIDINKDLSEVPFGFFFIRANVSLGELIYPAGIGKATLNATGTRTYAGEQREINHFTTQSGSAENIQEINIYYDKIRGVAVDYTNEISQTTDDQTVTTLESLTLTNPDQLTIPEFPQTLTLFATIIGITAIVAIKRKKNH